jgi:hypothetical protein
MLIQCIAVDRVLKMYLERAREVIGERTPEEVRYDNKIAAGLNAGKDIRSAVAEANRQFPDEALQPLPDQWEDVAARYDYIRQHNELLLKLGIKE